MTTNSLSRAEKVAAIREHLAARPGWTHAEVAAELGMTRSALRNLLNDPDGSKQLARRKRYRKPCPRCGTLMDGSGGPGRGPTCCARCAAASGHANRKWTAEAVIDAIRRFAAANGRPPTATEWINCDRQNDYPARAIVYRSAGWKNAPFASWADAIEAAGFPRPRVGFYERTDAWRASRSTAGIAWTPDQIVEAIRRWHRDNGRPPGMRDWKHAGADHPSNHTVVNHFGTWNAAIAAAGFAPLARGRTRRWEAA